jgi:hypothetical protein
MAYCRYFLGPHRRLVSLRPPNKYGSIPTGLSSVHVKYGAWGSFEVEAEVEVERGGLEPP